MQTDWESCYRSGDTPWDKGAPAPPLLEWLAQPDHVLSGQVLVPGSGYGHDVRAIAELPAVRQVIGLDISPAANAEAVRSTSTERAKFVLGDFFAPPPDFAGAFDWVFEHTCFCAIDPARRLDYAVAAARALRPGGHLLAIFYLQPWKENDTPPPGGGPPFETSREELDAVFRDRFDLLEDAVPTRAYRGREGRELLRLFRRR